LRTLRVVSTMNCHPERSRGICGAPFGLPKFWSSHPDTEALTISGAHVDKLLSFRILCIVK
jgi:hypothetical protein